MTRAPNCPSLLATSKPIPVLAPVTTAVLPASDTPASTSSNSWRISLVVSTVLVLLLAPSTGLCSWRRELCVALLTRRCIRAMQLSNKDARLWAWPPRTARRSKRDRPTDKASEEDSTTPGR
eukprot:scaffold705_cov402-Prasinococcus_capsulatus_cf.AAC.38